MARALILKVINSIIIDSCINNNQIVLSFDDGPGNNSMKIMNILNKHKVSGTFFVNGIHIIQENKYKIIKDLYDNNHTIASHGFSHADLLKLNTFNQMREIYDNELIFRQILNVRPKFFRPPYFDYDDNLVYLLENTFGYNVIVTNLDSNDWYTENATDIYNTFVYNFKENMGVSFISLNHEQVIESVDVLEKIILYVKSQNFTFVSMYECTGIYPYQQDNYYSPFLTNGILGN